ncbi:hypothetical protein ATKI12_5852 [Kitasatospora sp. Ki12]
MPQSAAVVIGLNDIPCGRCRPKPAPPRGPGGGAPSREGAP